MCQLENVGRTGVSLGKGVMGEPVLFSFGYFATTVYPILGSSPEW